LMGSTGHRGAHGADATGPFRFGAGLPEDGGRRHDEIRIAAAKFAITELQLVEHAGREAFEHHVGPLREAHHELAALRIANVERDASLAGVQIVIAHRAFRPRASVLEWAEGAHRIDAARAFNLDDIGAEIGEIASAHRADHHPTEIEDVNSFKRRRHLDLLNYRVREERLDLNARESK